MHFVSLFSILIFLKGVLLIQSFEEIPFASDSGLKWATHGRRSEGVSIMVAWALPDRCRPFRFLDILDLGVWILDVGFLYFCSFGSWNDLEFGIFRLAI